MDGSTFEYSENLFRRQNERLNVGLEQWLEDSVTVLTWRLPWVNQGPKYKKSNANGRNSPWRKLTGLLTFPINSALEISARYRLGNWEDALGLTADQITKRGYELSIRGIQMILRGEVADGLFVYLDGALHDMADGIRSRSEWGGLPHVLAQLWAWKKCNRKYSHDKGQLIDALTDRLIEYDCAQLIVAEIGDAYGSCIDSRIGAFLDELPLTVCLASMYRAWAERCGYIVPESGTNRTEFYGTSAGRRILLAKLALMVQRRAPWKELYQALQDFAQYNVLVARARIDQAKWQPVAPEAKEELQRKGLQRYEAFNRQYQFWQENEWQLGQGQPEMFIPG